VTVSISIINFQVASICWS